ncbi:hypothetical protein D3C87_966390 [compost metagenome]
MGEILRLAALLGDLEDDLLGLVERVLDLALLVEGQFDDLGTARDQRSQRAFFFDDLGVVLDVGSRRNRRRQIHQVAVAPYRIELFLAAKQGRDGDEVDRFAPLRQVADRLENDAVSLAVEVIRPQELGDFSDGIGRDQEGAEHGLLGLDILWGNPFDEIAHGGWLYSSVTWTLSLAVTSGCILTTRL